MFRKRFLTSLIATLLIVAFPQPAGLSADAPAPFPYSRSHRLPVPGDVLRPADIPEHNWQSGHRGVDLAANPEDPIRASRGGVVHFVGVVAGTPVISIQHSDGIRTTYEPVIAQVSKGAKVTRGQVIGYLTNSAQLGPHARRDPGLSWGAKSGPDSYIDPLTLVGNARVILKD